MTTRRVIVTGAALALLSGPAMLAAAQQEPEQSKSAQRAVERRESAPAGPAEQRTAQPREGGGSTERASPPSRGGESERSGGGNTGGGRADRDGDRTGRWGDMPRARAGREAAGTRDAGGTTSARSAGGSTTSDLNDAASRAVPRYSRPRGDNYPVGEAVARGSVAMIRPGFSGSGFYYYPYSSYYGSPYSYYGSVYSPYWAPFYYGAFGLGYLYYDPWWSGAWGYGAPGYSGYGGYPTYSSGQARYGGALRLKVKPRDAQVYVDGYYVGLIDDFDGMFQRLTLDAGSHRIEVRAPGYETIVFDVRIEPGQTIRYERDLARIP